MYDALSPWQPGLGDYCIFSLPRKKKIFMDILSVLCLPSSTTTKLPVDCSSGADTVQPISRTLNLDKSGNTRGPLVHP
jgi:hypothetical protein